MDLKFIRGKDSINFHRPSIFFVLGVRGGGKSSLLENIAEGYLETNNTVFDLFGSRDGEALAWLRSKWAKDKKILLLRGENVDVDASFPVKQVDAVTLKDFEDNDLVISTSPLHLNPDQEFNDAATLTDLLYKRLHYKKIVYMVVREAANLYYSRLKVSDNQLFAKAQMVYLVREARHMGLSLGLDSLRMYAVDIDLRHLTDYLFLKSQGVQGLSKDLKWLYSYVGTSLLRNMKPHRFILVSRNGAIGYGTFPYPEWHKREREDILNEVGIKVEYGEQIVDSVLKGTYKTVGDKEHAEIIRLYIEENIGTCEIAEKLKRSSRTPVLHINSHNEAVKRSGFCAACKRVESPYSHREAARAGTVSCSRN